MKKGKLLTINAKKTRERIVAESENDLGFGIQFLDDCFLGIRKNDLITIGAESGYGKTELATLIACNNARKGNSVYYFALEAHEREIELRIAYKIASHKYYTDKPQRQFPVSYPLYVTNKIDSGFMPYAIYGEEETERLYKENLFIIHRGIEGYNVNNFIEAFKSLDVLADMIIVDHINYFDTIGSMNERRNLSYAAKKINEMVNIYEVPVIIIAHLNRPEKNSERIVPDQHSIHGSSDITKESTKVIFIAKEKKERDTEEKYIYPTIFYPAKFRGMGMMEKYIGLVDYDIRTNRYEKKYIVGKLNYNITGYKYLQGDNKPFWATYGI